MYTSCLIAGFSKREVLQASLVWGKVLSNQPTSEANPTACVEGRIFFKAETGIVLFGWQGRVRSESEVQAAC